MVAARADAQSLSIPLQGALGEIATGTANDTFAWDTSGNVTHSGTAVRIGSGNTRIGVQVNCPTGGCKNPVTVTVTAAGSLTHRAGALTGFTIAAGSNVSSLTTSGGSAHFTIATPSTFGIFYVGADYPIYGDGSGKSSGVSNSPFSVSAWQCCTKSKNDWSIAPTAGTSTATVFRSMALSNPTPLSFGRIVRPSSGSAVIHLDDSTGAITATPAVALSSPSPSRATYSLTAEAGSVVSISIPSSFSLSGPISIPVTLTNTTTPSVTLSGSYGSAYTLSFGVGGSMTVGSTTPSGSYSGTYSVSVNYN